MVCLQGANFYRMLIMVFFEHGNVDAVHKAVGVGRISLLVDRPFCNEVGSVEIVICLDGPSCLRVVNVPIAVLVKLGN